ncbi:MAG: hypothetical protein PHR30_09845 [Gallionellaceae bacterium]|nr:hypothetical protein [Gallionellaceae bacterium]
MIPSSPRRTWTFLIASSLAFFAPDLLVPNSLAQDPAYLLLYNLYQGALLLALFWYGPQLCRALVMREVDAGPGHETVAHSLAALRNAHFRLPKLPVTLAEHPAPFIVTAGLLPGHSQVFLSSGMVARLGPFGLRFLLARALAHGSLAQRLAAALPILALTVLWPDNYSDPRTWLMLAAFSAAWLALHWSFELRADRLAALAMGPEALRGLGELQASGLGALGALSLQPPLRWRLRMVAAA